MTRRTQIENIHALAELERYGIPYEQAGDNEVKFKCPAHEDNEPSAGLNTETNVWRCRSAACGESGDIIKLLSLHMRQERQIIREELSKYYDLEDLKELNPAPIEQWHQRIWNAGPLLTELRNRGLTDDDIREHRLGFDKDRITIPIYDMSGRIVNVRKYLPGAPGKLKMRNTTNYGGARLYKIEQTSKYDTLWICGGEMKTIVAARLLNPRGVGAICPTGGEGTWDESFNSYIKGKKIYICLDVDVGGQEGSRRLADKIYSVASEVHIVRLPLDQKVYPKGDINDWVKFEDAGESEFAEIESSTVQWHPVNRIEEETPEAEVKTIRLEQAIVAESLGEKIRCEAVVSAMDTTPYLIPKTVGISCTRDQPSCHRCPVKALEINPDTGYTQMTINGTSPGILEMVGVGDSALKAGVYKALRIPSCKVVESHTYSYWNILDVRLAPQLALSTESSENIQPVSAMAVDLKLDLNSPYLFSGRVYPSPKNQQATMVMNQAGSAEDNLSNFEPTDEDISNLSIFKPREWTCDSVTDKLAQIYGDFETNITRIFHRRDLHTLVDLCYHSVLLFNFDGQITKGWTNVLVVGDSSQGKSETSGRMREHYGLGEKIEGKNTTRAGILGGVQQLGSRWFVSWGAIPKNDRRLVMVEELKGMPKEVLASLTDMRSSGVAEITMIENRRAHARTRLIAISNPRSNKSVSQYNYGVDTISELIGAIEDVRRFDIAGVISAKQVDPSEINQLAANRPKREHIFTSEKCRKLILWGWTRRPEECIFEDAATQMVMKGANQLCKIFHEDLPLCDKGSMRHKLARLAAAIAVRTFSHHDEKPGTVLVRECHVEFMIKFLIRTYSDEVFGYKEYSEAKFATETVIDGAQIRASIMGTKHPDSLVDHLLNHQEIMPMDISDWCDIDRDLAQQMLSLFVRKNAVQRVGRAYEKTSAFIAELKEMKTLAIKTTSPSDKDEF